MAGGPIDETRAWTSLSMNLLVLPGLGSFLVGRRIAGAAQAVVALLGAGMSLWWMILLSAQWVRDGAFPFDGGDDFGVGVTGVIVFGAAWLWSLATGMAVVRDARKVSHGRTQPRRTGNFLVTGTDTGVGKTVVAAGLVLALRKRGRTVTGFKPVETGVGPGALTDSALLARASGTEHPSARPLLTLSEALAPPVAADRAGIAVTGEEIEGRVRALRGHRDGVVVVEGAGGVAVPLAWGYTALDLAANLGLTAVVVARAGLGTLNHVWLTVEALRARGIPIAAVVLNGAASPPDLAEATNPEALARILPGVRCLSLPRQDTSDPWEVSSRLAPLLDPILED